MAYLWRNRGNIVMSGDPRHLTGSVAKGISQKILRRNGSYIFLSFRKNGPIDMYAVHPDDAQYRLDIRTDRYRKKPL